MPRCSMPGLDFKIIPAGFNAPLEFLTGLTFKSMFKTLTRDKIISLSAFKPEIKRSLKGVARFVDGKGATKGYFFDLEAWKDLLEDLETSSPAFTEEMEESIASGRVSGKKVKAGVV